MKPRMSSGSGCNSDSRTLGGSQCPQNRSLDPPHAAPDVRIKMGNLQCSTAIARITTRYAAGQAIASWRLLVDLSQSSHPSIGVTDNIRLRKIATGCLQKLQMELCKARCIPAAPGTISAQRDLGHVQRLSLRIVASNMP